ncbi:dTDP-4-dehydrorhamnose reductase [Chitinophaga skermanii]|uniref:dTDP-4-dehydrorhamnose reductase n=1 Tax=Chitinophaga skermanii TaxID=331697 RepID=A0A327QE17_9BACT|nr:dTDP-4-dehydrorhamnose reductase [Chitinophaga skermanii]RAI99886.1 dTDP-4-dehydrorhamnose reductase [Chitinophaga skermanii]
MENILVTGGYGQLGQTFQALAGRYPQYNFTFTDVEQLDITNQDAVNAFLAGGQFAYLINCAAYTAVDKAETEEEIAFKLNFEATLYLAEACAANNTQLIHVSTDYVFDGKANKPYKETEEASPNSVYGASKARGEAVALGSDPRSIVLRTSWLYSNYGVNFANRMQQLMAERNELNIVFDQVGTPTYAGDLAQAIMAIIETVSVNRDHQLGGVYHFSNEGVASWFDFAYAIKELTGAACEVFPITSEAYPTPAQRPTYSVLNKTKIKETFGIKIPYWKESLRTCLGK